MKPKLIIAGGGTGGHIFPGLAVATAFQNLGGEVLWVGSSQGKESQFVTEAGFKIFIIQVAPLKGFKLFSKLKTLIGLPLAVFKAFRLLTTHKPDSVLGVGGYASFPTVLAAYLKRIPVALSEQNAYAGLTNRLLSFCAQTVFLSFEDDYKQFNPKKTKVVGNAIRTGVQPTPYPLTKKPFHLLVTGGSLGAKALNHVFCEALDLLKNRFSELSVTHQTGEVDALYCQAFYNERPALLSECAPFLKNMPEQYTRAHLIICRAGASTATEIALSQRAAIFIPYPFAAEDHQTKNAAYFVAREAALMKSQKDLTPEWLAQKITSFLDHPAPLEKMSEKMGQTAKPNAAHIIAQTLFNKGTKRV